MATRALRWPLVALLLLSSCAGTGTRAVRLAPAEIDRVELIDVSFTDLALAAHVVYHNTSSRPAAFPSYRWRLDLHDAPPLTGVGEQAFTVEPNATGSTRVPIAFHLPELLRRAPELSRRDRVPYTLTVTLEAPGRFTTHTVPAIYDGVLHLPQAPTLRLAGMRVWDQTWRDATVQIDVGLTPRATDGLRVRELDCQLTLNGVPVLEARADNLQVPLRQEVLVPLTARVSLGPTGQAVAAVLNRTEARFHLTGQALLDDPVLGVLRLPIDEAGTVTIERPQPQA